jgi:hypothetical protein
MMRHLAEFAIAPSNRVIGYQDRKGGWKEVQIETSVQLCNHSVVGRQFSAFRLRFRPWRRKVQMGCVHRPGTG